MAEIETYTTLSFMEKERTRFLSSISELMDRRQEINEQIAHEEKQLTAINAFFDALKPEVEMIPLPPLKSITKAKKSKHPGVRQTVLAYLKERGVQGATRATVLKGLGVGLGDKQKETSISNALAALKRTGRIDHDGRLYFATA